MTSDPTPRDLVVVSLEAWDDVWRRNQHLLHGLLQRDRALRVLFVEPPHDQLHSLVTGRGFAHGSGTRAHPDYEGRLVLFQPTKLLPRLLGGAADASWRRQVLRETARLGMQHPIIWVNDAQGAEIVRNRDWPALYDITDDWLAAPRPPRVRRRLARNEETLLEVCREVVVCSPALASSRGSRRSVRLIPNAVDVESYREPSVRPPDLAGHAALYVGTLHEDRLDLALIVQTARRLGREGTVTLIGPDALSSRVRERLGDAGVLILGPRPHTQIPAYLQNADVLLVPHVVDHFTESLDPIKLYEYLASGSPVVSTPVAGFRESRAPGLDIATVEEFPDLVLAAVRAPTRIPPTEDIPDWALRVADMAAVLEALYVDGHVPSGKFT